MAVQDGLVDRAVVPIENALEGGVAATLDALAGEADRVRIAGEVVHPIHHCLVAAGEIAARADHAGGVAPTGQRPVRALPARAAAASGARDRPLHGRRGDERAQRRRPRRRARVAARGRALRMPRARRERRGPLRQRHALRLARTRRRGEDPGPDAKTSIVFWGAGDESPGWLVEVLRQFADRGVNLTRIESRPRRVRLGHYMFFADLDGAAERPPVSEALEALRGRVEEIRVLGSYPAATGESGKAPG